MVSTAVLALTCRMVSSLLEWFELIAPASPSLESMQRFGVQEAREPETGRLPSWMI